MILNDKIGWFLKKLKRCRKGYTLVEAATVVAITGVMAIVVVPIASDRIEDSKVSTAQGTVMAINTALVKFNGDGANFPLADGSAGSVNGGSIADNKRIKILRSGLKGKENTIDNDNNLDPDLPPGTTAASGLGLWDTVTGSGAALKANAGTDGPNNTAPFFNLNSHVVSDDVAYGNNGVNWFGPYVPAIDQDPWGRNYLIYIAAVDRNNLRDSNGKGINDADAGSVFVPRDSNSPFRKVYGWIISAGPDKTLQTAPTDSILKNDDIGTLVSIPAVIKGAK